MVISAAMDLGSNTLRLLVAEVCKGQWRAVARALATPRLGRGLTKGESLAPSARQAASKAAKEFSAQARALGARSIYLGATQACRVAVDGESFVAELKRELGLDKARVLSGPEEARLSRMGALSRLQGSLKGAWLADVGGGSTELAELSQDGSEALSVKIGAVSLTEGFPSGDPPRPAELAEVDRAVKAALAEAGVLLKKKGCERLVATAGTAANTACILEGITEYDPERVNNLVISAEQLDSLAGKLAALPLSKRRRVRGMEPERADIIIAGMAILRGLLQTLNLKELTTMDAGLLEGILLDGAGFFFEGE